MKRYLIIAFLFILFVFSIYISFWVGYCYAGLYPEEIVPKEENPFCCHTITEDDIVSLSTAKQFSGRMMYSCNYDPSDRVVIPNETLAVKMGMLLLESLYGKDVYEEKPYYVALLDSVWVVETSIPIPPPPSKEDSVKLGTDMEFAPLRFGGVGHVEINKHNGKVYTIYHTK
ncbi:NTF2 fold immunity protein [Prevotella sp. tc2-28]|uniref:NTF2 fold immunity protein n=1 Tax=Prevotella sp. tc2-28 TaxID=1761888 RepID=UPI000896E6A7|nr:NTF2 fold immunity protein [Prevotella sp. tc2-28]SEA75006.1 NTF2 fold immunity protein [Prevotella sp. tc2-28]